MKKSFLSFCAAILLTGCFYSSGLWAAPINVTLDANVTVTKATLNVSAEEDLEFGEIIPKPGEEVQILVNAKEGAATEASLKKGHATLTGNAHSGLVKVTSPIACQLSITYAVAGNQITESGSSNNRTLELQSDDVAKYSTKSPLTVQADTETDIHIGGLLTIPDNLQDDGFDEAYTGTITVSVDYN